MASAKTGELFIVYMYTHFHQVPSIAIYPSKISIDLSTYWNALPYPLSSINNPHRNRTSIINNSSSGLSDRDRPLLLTSLFYL